ncbi:6920_t:CDS:1, partial [Entrophospora sp. SA101]
PQKKTRNMDIDIHKEQLNLQKNIQKLDKVVETFSSDSSSEIDVNNYEMEE